MEISLISIVIPCYNHGKYLEEAFNSILIQSYTHFECIIVDDGSTDNSRVIAEKICEVDARFSYHYIPNSGLSRARNFGIRQSKGKYIQFLDADDKIQVHKLKESVITLDENPKIDIVYTYALYFDTKTPNDLWPNRIFTDEEWMLKKNGFGKDILPPLLIWNIMPVSSPVLRMTLINQIGCFSPFLKAFEDWDYWIRCALKNLYFQYLPYNGNNATLIRSGYQSMMSSTLIMRQNELAVKIKYGKISYSTLKNIYFLILNINSLEEFIRLFKYMLSK